MPVGLQAGEDLLRQLLTHQGLDEFALGRLVFGGRRGGRWRVHATRGGKGEQGGEHESLHPWVLLGAAPSAIAAEDGGTSRGRHPGEYPGAVQRESGSFAAVMFVTDPSGSNIPYPGTRDHPLPDFLRE
ncbi:hypothetical protein D187_004764 [Cystobacter fuscus DSM 2262]|uniref:Uncharacterized protein n=1 Tax=Cystobacter fuscus (strain ATCC 25194 / DSM 2262 / NBRC 100088 / M29) TaxID=1242864 RepID=S9Q8S3_CYSF2|nr:hypothetical protein D187_004764 [Cystobacter fuscus DSM 2262]